MAVLKNRTQGNFVIVSQNITHDNNLGLVERGLLLTLISLPDGWNLSIKGLQSILPDGKDRISNALNRLIEIGYVTREQERGSAGKFGNNILEVHETPVKQSDAEAIDPQTAEPSAENPHADDPIPPAPSAVNLQQLNTTEELRNIGLKNKESSIKECKTDDLSPGEYDQLVSEYGRDIVDYNINKIRSRNYRNCYNYSTISQWCREYKERQPVKPKNVVKGSFFDYPQREYDYAELEKLVGIR